MTDLTISLATEVAVIATFASAEDGRITDFGAAFVKRTPPQDRCIGSGFAGLTFGDIVVDSFWVFHPALWSKLLILITISRS